jgi:hypothetical protein
MDYSLYHYEMTFFVYSNFYLKNASSDMSMATPAFFQAVFSWKIFYQPFTLSLGLSLTLGCIFCRKKSGWVLFFNSAWQSVSFGERMQTISIQRIIERYSNSCHFVLL